MPRPRGEGLPHSKCSTRLVWAGCPSSLDIPCDHGFKLVRAWLTRGFDEAACQPLRTPLNQRCHPRVRFLGPLGPNRRQVRQIPLREERPEFVARFSQRRSGKGSREPRSAAPVREGSANGSTSNRPGHSGANGNPRHGTDCCDSAFIQSPEFSGRVDSA